MPSILPLLLAFAIVISAAKVGGWLLNRLGQPPVLGELLVGLLLGPSVLNLFALPYFAETHTVETLREFGELGVLFLMFSAGLEIQLADLMRTGKPAVYTGVLGVLVPIVFSLGVIPLFGYTLAQAFFMGIVLAATSVSISAQTLMELGFLRSKEGLILLGAAVVDDVLAVAVLSAFVAIATSGSAAIVGSIWVVVRMLLFLLCAFWLSRWLLPKLAGRVVRLPISEAVMSLAVISIMLLAWAAETIGGVAAITGAFVAGLAFSTSGEKAQIEEGIHTLNYAFFVPLFMVSIGLTADARSLSAGDLGFAMALCVVAVVSKVIGAGGGAKAGGTTWREALRIGVGMVSRGEVGLIVAGVGVSNGLIQADVFTVVVIVVIVTTLLTPPMLRWSFQRKEANDAGTRGVRA
jgi:Kef-type K+ transport system membrane component KefB